MSKLPRLVGDLTRHDGFSEGEFGLINFLPAVACIASDNKLVDRVLPDIKEQEYGPLVSYAGINRFSLCRFGTWTEVVVDDLLPAKKGRLLCCQDRQSGVYWCSLLEKACAK